MDLKTQIISKFCDIQTSDNEWRLGIIENTRGNILKDKDLLEVHLDGWSINKNQVTLNNIESLYTFTTNTTTSISLKRIYGTNVLASTQIRFQFKPNKPY